MSKKVKYAMATTVLFFGLSLQPATAQTLMRESTCTQTIGSVALTYDCSFNVKHYQPETPVELYIDFYCGDNCVQVLGFGLRKRDFYTPADVSGRLMGGARTDTGLWILFRFDSLKRTGKSYAGSAHFTIPVMVSDGNGTTLQMLLDADLHVKTD